MELGGCKNPLTSPRFSRPSMVRDKEGNVASPSRMSPGLEPELIPSQLSAMLWRSVRITPLTFREIRWRPNVPSATRQFEPTIDQCFCSTRRSSVCASSTKDRWQSGSSYIVCSLASIIGIKRSMLETSLCLPSTDSTLLPSVIYSILKITGLPLIR